MIEVRDSQRHSLPNSPVRTPALAAETQDLSDVIGDLTTPVPDETLIFLVNGHHNRRQYVQTRRETLPGMLALLRTAGVDYAKFRAVLDFGCGCGRILAGWEHLLPPGAELLGCDINPALIAFCRENIRFANTWVSSIEPPLGCLADASMDFVYAASVFSHVTFTSAKAWAMEMQRIVRPSGILMMSYCGSYYEETLAKHSSTGLRELKRVGFYCYLHGAPEQSSLGSNDYATYMTTGFAKDLFRDFELIYLREGLLEGPHTIASYQDIAIFRRHSAVL
jgi:SAM-dependent methyltransferase